MWLNCELSRSHTVFSLIVGACFALLGIGVRFFVGAPYFTILALGIESLLPPIWLMCVLWTLSFFSIGFAFCFVLCYRSGCYEVEKYKGGMVFVLMAVLELCWYPTFFGVGLIFLSVLESAVIFLLSVGVTRYFWRVSELSGGVMLLHNGWLLYILILNFAVFFK